jgi:3-oxoacyl-[acyl-carrier protein] reductase
MRLANKAAIITGAGSGMGRASACLFAKEGAKVSVVDINVAGGQETIELIKRSGGVAQFIKADVTKASEVEQMVQATVNAYARLDILFNNAGVPMSFTPIEEVSEELYDKILAVNLKGVFWGCKYATPIMKKQGGGVIINTASIAGVRARPGLNVYCASKGGVIMLTKALAIELAPYKIRVNAINPVATDTPMLPGFIGDRDLEEGREAFIATIPLGRLAMPEDIANAALYLASDESSMLTGACIDVDGGRGI